MPVDTASTSDAVPASVTIGPVGVINALGWQHEKVFANYLGCMPNFTHLELAPDQQTLLAKVDNSALEPLPALYDNLAISLREQRMLRLAMMALNECLSQVECEHPLPLFLALPAEDEAPSSDEFPGLLNHLCGEQLAVDQSRLINGGRAAGIAALHKAFEVINSGAYSRVIVGGVDSLVTEKTLDELISAQRLVINSHFDAIIPGEAAVFVLLEAVEGVDNPGPMLMATQISNDKDDALNDEDHLPVGMAQVVTRLRESIDSDALQPKTLFPPFNGESRWVEEWGECNLKNNQFISARARYEIPASFCGDMGAAHSLFAVALCADQLSIGLMKGPVLVCAASDQFMRSAAIVDGRPKNKRIAA